MTLRLRLTLLVAVGFILLVGGLIAAVWLREAATDERFADARLKGQTILWDKIVENHLQSLSTRLAPLPPLAAAELLGQAPPQSGDAIADAAGKLAQDARVAQLDLLNQTGAIVFVNSRDAQPAAILDAAVVGGLLRIGGEWRGITQGADRRFRLSVGRAVLGPDGKPIGILAAAVDADAALAELSRSVGGAAYLLNLRGRMANGVDSALWGKLDPRPPLRRASVQRLSADEHLFLAASAPLLDAAGRPIGVLSTLTDETDALRRHDRIAAVTLSAAAGGILLLLALLWWEARRAFDPLEQAVAALKALAGGDDAEIDPDLDAAADRDDEIGRIAAAVAVFRDHARQLASLREQRERLRRRQERLIRRRMQDLASTLNSAARAEVLADLDAEVGRSGAAGGDQLGLLTGVLRLLTDRVADQHRQLNAMVDELREALKNKVLLAGLQQELEIARRIQASILPRSFPARTEIEIQGRMTPAKEVGGDFYDFFAIDDRRVAVVIGDVSGKGVPAAFFMAMARTLLKATALFTPSPGVCVQSLNDMLAADNDQMMFVTLFFGLVDLRNGEMCYVNAGHLPPLLLTEQGVVAIPPTDGMAVAVMEDMPYAEGRVSFNPGDTMILFTDGVTEAFDIDGGIYGDDRLLTELSRGYRNWPIDAALDQLEGAVKNFARGAPPADDLTLVALRWRGQRGVGP